MRLAIAGLIALAILGCTAGARLQAPPGLALETRGRGSDIVLVHGALGDYRQWRPMTGILSRDHRVIAISRRFHWPSTAVTDTAYSFDAQAADLEAFLGRLDAPVHLVGHSYGAGVVLLAALHHPERVRSLILIEPPFGSVASPDSPGFDAERASRDSMVVAVRAAAARGPESAAEAMMDWMQGGAGGYRRLSAPVRGQLVANAATAVPMFATRPPRVTCDQLRALPMPVLVVRGENTRPWFRMLSDATAGCIPHAETAVIPAVGHMSVVENPAAVAHRIAAFISNHP